ncbi:MAG: acyltransferase family protein [Pseudohaliea sp.]
MSSGPGLRAGVRRPDDYQLELECLRGWAITLVFLFHAWGISVGGGAREPIPPWLAFVVAGNTGVTLFFVLSGFLLSRPWLRSLQGTRPPPATRNYLVARALRILPLYYLAVAVAMLASGEPGRVLPALWFRFLGFEVFPWSVVWWTLITEVQFYLVLPLAGWLACRGPGGRRLLLALLLAWGFAYAVLVTGGGESKGFLLTKSLFARLPAFLLGAAAAWLSLHSARLARAPAWQRLAGTLLCLVLLAFLLQTVTAMGDRAAEQRWHLHHSLEAALWAALLLLLLAGPFPARTLMINRPLAWVGKLSYSIYLNHVPILFYLIFPAKAGVENYAGSLAAWGWPLLGATLSLALAAVTWRFVELPFLNLKGRLAR